WNSHARQLNSRFGSIDDDGVTLGHRGISTNLTLGRYDNNVFGKIRKDPLNLGDQGLSRWQCPSDLGRMHANQQLQLRARCEISNGLDYPFEHVREGVGPIVQLGI